jgi:photosystem II stability/assembly factor-like uncharacterized protein
VTARHSAKTLNDRLGWPHTTTVRASYGLAGVDFIDQQNGWAVGYNNVSENAIILHTTDGGAHWRNRSPLAWYAYELAGIDALDPAHIWTAGSESWVDSLITGSTDGSTWKTEPSPTVEYLMSVDFTDAQNGWVSGTNGALLHTTDGGAHWAKAPTWAGARGEDLWAVDFTDTQHGWVAGGNAATLTGFIQRTTDGGQSWTLQQVVPGAVLYGIEAPRCAVGGDPVTGAGVAYYSTDGGAIWAPSAGVPADTCLARVTRAPGGTVDWAVGSAGTVLESTDGGAAWTSPATPVPATFDLAAASFTSDTDGWIVGDGEQMLRTTDGGASWQTTTVDVLWPRAHARGIEFPLSGRPEEIRFGYQVLDNVSSTATVTITVTRHGTVIRRWRLGSQPCGGLQWTPRFTFALPPGHYLMHVSAVDESGNRSRQRPFSSLGFDIAH